MSGQAVANEDPGVTLAGIALRVRHEGDMSARSGQFDRLHQIADELEVLASRVAPPCLDESGGAA